MAPVVATTLCLTINLSVILHLYSLLQKQYLKQCIAYIRLPIALAYYTVLPLGQYFSSNLTLESYGELASLNYK